MASPCASAVPLVKSTPAPCTGVLFSEAATKDALKCKRVELPKLRGELGLCHRIHEIQKNALTTRAESAESLLRAVPQPPPRWVLPTITTGAVLLGVGVGFFLTKGIP